MAEADPVGTDLEWQARVDLAACYRLVALHGWDDLLATHISARVPGAADTFLVNQMGLAFDEITASSLVRVRLDGTVIDADRPINPAGFTIHSAIHEVRDDAHCVLHLHTPDGMAVSALAEGLLPLNQSAMLVCGDVAYHDFEGVALRLDERERLQRNLGRRNFLILRNHGTLVTGNSVGEAFVRAFLLEKSCAAQVRTLAMGRPLAEASAESRERTAEVGASMGAGYAGLVWGAMNRRLQRLGSDHAR